MERVLVLRMAGYEIENARDLLERHVNASGALPYDAAIVINTIGSGLLPKIMGNNVTQPRPFGWQYDVGFKVLTQTTMLCTRRALNVLVPATMLWCTRRALRFC